MWAVTVSLVDFTHHLFREHRLTIQETFLVINSFYTNILDQMLQCGTSKLNMDEMKSFLISKVQQVIDTIENDLPIEDNNDEQNK